jgi:hypothetical protein
MARNVRSLRTLKPKRPKMNSVYTETINRDLIHNQIAVILYATSTVHEGYDIDIITDLPEMVEVKYKLKEVAQLN